MLVPYGDRDNSDYQKQQVLTAIVQAKQNGLSNEEIVANVWEALPSSMASYAETVLQQIDFQTKLSRSVIEFDLEFLFQAVYAAALSLTSDEEILSICSEHCTLNQYEFVRYALEYIHVNRVPSEWEQNNVYRKILEIITLSPIESLFEYIDGALCRLQCLQRLPNKLFTLFTFSTTFQVDAGLTSPKKIPTFHC